MSFRTASPAHTKQLTTNTVPSVPVTSKYQGMQGQQLHSLHNFSHPFGVGLLCGARQTTHMPASARIKPPNQAEAPSAPEPHKSTCMPGGLRTICPRLGPLMDARTATAMKEAKAQGRIQFRAQSASPMYCSGPADSP